MAGRRKGIQNKIEPNEDFYIDAKEWTDEESNLDSIKQEGEGKNTQAGNTKKKWNKEKGYWENEKYKSGLPKVVTGISQRGTAETNRWVMAMQLRLNGGWKWDNKTNKFVRKKQWFNSIDMWFDWASGVRKMVTMIKLLGGKVDKNPYYMFLNVDNKTDGLISTRVTTREVENELLIEKMSKRSGLSRQEIKELLIVNSMPGRTARMIYYEIEKIQEKIDRNMGNDTFLGVLAASERDGVDIGGLLDKDKREVILEQWEIEMITEWMECYNGITEEQVQTRYEQVIKRYMLPKGKETEKKLRDKIKKLLTSEVFRDRYSYNANTYNRSYGLYKGEEKRYDGQIQGWNGEQDMYN